MKKRVFALTGLLIFTCMLAVSVSAQERTTVKKETVKKELTDKAKEELRKELGMTKEEFAKLPEKCLTCPSLRKCVGQKNAKVIAKKEEGAATACTEEDLAGNKGKARGKKKVIK